MQRHGLKDAGADILAGSSPCHFLGWLNFGTVLMFPNSKKVKDN